jgi:UDP-N-acetylmuramyl pentapeptide phosphotransferase/UDP-N-acetylglucosamine-1-phosphate transferase
MLVLVIGLIAVGVWNGGSRFYVLAGAASVIAVVSFLDDLHPLSARVRFAAQAIAAIIFLILEVKSSITAETASATLVPVVLGAILLLWLVGYTNAFNFMDGINGIAAGQAAITGIGTALIAALASSDNGNSLSIASMVLAGSAIGFLPHNFPRARMFMGDVGSAPLGFALAALSLLVAARYGWMLLIPLFFLHLNYTLDTSITLLRRWLRGERIYEAHKEHFYQRLVRSGKSHPFTTGIEMALQVVTLALALACLKFTLPAQIGVGVIVVLIWLSFFAYAELLFRKSARQTARQTDLPRPSHA